MRRFVTTALFALIATPTMADPTIQDAWVRATVPQQKATGAFMQITASKAARLVGASSPVAGVTEIHEMTMDKDVMRMRAVSGIDLPAGKTVDLKPGGYHVMLMDLKAPIAEGQDVPVTLVIEHADKTRERVLVNAAARGLGTSGAAGHKH